MNNINVSVGNDLIIDSSDLHKIKVRRSNNSNNAFELKDDGIFMDETYVSAGNGFKDQTSTGLRIGWMTEYERTTEPTHTGHISASSIVHRVFTAKAHTADTPKTYMLIDFRAKIDFISPGDIVRVPTEDGTKYAYYLVISTTSGNVKIDGYIGNEIERVALLCVW